MAEATLSEQTEVGQTWWVAPWEFAVRALVGILIFAVIAAGAIALDVLVRYLECHGINRIIVWGLRMAEFAVFFSDLGLFLVFIWRTFTRTLRKL
jgi:hypothetical protein